MHGRKHRDSHQALLRRLQDMAEGKIGTMSPVAEGKIGTAFGMGCMGLFACWSANTPRCHPSCWELLCSAALHVCL